MESPPSVFSTGTTPLQPGAFRRRWRTPRRGEETGNGSRVAARVRGRTVLRQLACLLGLTFLSACGPGTFFGTWSDIATNPEARQESLKNPPFPIQAPPLFKAKRLTQLPYAQVVGVGNRQSTFMSVLRTNAWTGFAVASGDLNGDGLDDIVVGAPESEGVLKETTRSGWVYVLLGSRDMPHSQELARSAQLRLWGGDDAGQNLFGHAVLVTDLNGDGFGDLVVGAPHANGMQDDRIHAGAVYVYFGRPQPSGSIDLSKRADMVLFGAGEGDQTGYALAAGDVDGDGIQDLVIGAPKSSAQSEHPQAGAVYVIRGRPHFPRRVDLKKHWDSRFLGIDSPSALSLDENLADQAGHALLVADLNGDGLQDIVIGAPFADGFLNRDIEAGEVYVVLGQTRLPKELPLAQADVTLYGAATSDQAGQALGTADLNGDGVADLIISAPAASRTFHKGSLKTLFHGVFGKVRLEKNYLLKTSSDLTFSGDTAAPCSGSSVGPSFLGELNAGRSFSALDLDGDGLSDLVVGVPCSRGDLNRGNAGELTFFKTRLDRKLIGPTAVFQPQDLKADTYLGYALSLGDLNGDGKPDLIVGAPGLQGGPDTGVPGGVFLFLGIGKH